MAKKKSAKKRRPSTFQERQAAIREIRKRLQEVKPVRKSRTLHLVISPSAVVTGEGRMAQVAYVFWNKAGAKKHAEYRNQVFREAAEVITVREVQK